MCSDCSQPRLLPSAQPAALAYLACRTQWSYAPSGVPTGLRYADCMVQLQPLARQLDMTVDALWVGLQVIERAVIAVAIERCRKEPSHER